MLEKKCCDPFKVHGKKGSKSSLPEITFQTAKVFQDNNIPVTPGQRLCPKCRIKFGDLHDNDLSGEVHDDTSSDEIHDNDDSFHKEYLSTSMEEMDVSPVKLHAAALHKTLIQGSLMERENSNK